MKDLQGEEPLASVAKAFFDWCGDCDTPHCMERNDFGVLEKNLAHIGMKIPEQLGRYDVQMAYAYRTGEQHPQLCPKSRGGGHGVAGTGGTGIPRCLLRCPVYSCYRAGTNRTLRTLPAVEELQALKNTLVKPKKPKLPLMYSVKKQ